MTADAETAYAKLNLALHVRRRRDDGYHDIETLFAFCADGDTVRAEAADDLSLTIDGPFAEGLSTGADNLVLRGATALRDASGAAAGAALRLTKRLPVASGIGGGSADAAAALRLLVRFWRTDLPAARMHAIAASLGADVPACLLSRPCRGEGRGDALEPLDEGGLAGCPVLLVNPRVATPTGSVFAGWGGTDRGPLGRGDPLDSARAGANDLEAPARRLVPQVDEVLDRLRRCDGAGFVRMSGSGATCFALFDDAETRNAAAAAVASDRPEWWTLATTLR